jgi:hypothetical protein
MNQERQPIWIVALLREHPALLASVVYFAASAIGMFYSWAFLRHFGINVFNHAQIGDFLLASLKEPVTWLLVLAAIVAMVFDNAMSQRFHQKNKIRWLRWYGSNVYRSVNYLVAVGLIILFLHVHAERRAEETMGGDGDYVKVRLTDGGTPRTAMLLGTTGQFIFLYDAESHIVDIHPNENVQTISLKAPD